jgi:hypothetical protein
MLLLSKKTYILKKPRLLSFELMHVPAFLIFLILSLSIFLPNVAVSAEGVFGSERFLEPRLKKQQEEEARKERDRKRKALEATQQNSKSSRSFNFGQEKDKKSEEEKAFEENKEYMSYWQRMKHSWKYANNFQDIFDQSLDTSYAPAKVKSPFLNIRSGPGRNYPIIYIAERGELVDFTAIRTEWYQLRTADGHFGWAHMSELPENLEFEVEIEGLGFADEAKLIATRGSPIDLGFAGGFLGDDPIMLAYIKNRNTHFISTELELGLSRGGAIGNDLISANLLAHPFPEIKRRPHFLLGIGRITSRFDLADGTTESESNLFAKAGFGITQDLSQRLRFRADISQYSVDSTNEKLNHYTQFTIGSAFLWGGSTDDILNRTIGENVSVTNLEVTLYSGNINLSQAESASIKGLRTTYHASEDHFFELNFSDGSQDYKQLSFSVGRNLLPTEYIIRWRQHKNYWPAQFYALAGTGMQTLDQDEQISLVLGAGFKINPLRRFALRIDVRENIVYQQTYQGNYLGKYVKNPELTFGLSGYF